MTDDVIVAAGQTVTVEIPGTDRVYTLRAPTFGEAGELAARAASSVEPNDAIFNEALRDALGRADLADEVKAEHLAAIASAEDADDALSALYSVHGTDPSAYGEAAKREVAEAQRAMLTAQRKRARAEWLVRGDEALAALRQHQIRTRRMQQIEVAALCLGVSVQDVDALPAADVLLISERAGRLLRPTPAAEKN